MGTNDNFYIGIRNRGTSRQDPRQISDAILDDILSKDPNSRVACETAVTTGLILVMGEITTDCYVDIPHLARETVREIGYTRAKYGFDSETCAVLTTIDEQSPDIALGVDSSWETQTGEGKDLLDSLGAGDQGMVFGYASNETPEYAGADFLCPPAYPQAGRGEKEDPPLFATGQNPK